MKSVTTIVVTLTVLFFIGELGAKYLLVEMDGIKKPIKPKPIKPSPKNSNIDSDYGGGSVGAPELPGGKGPLVQYTHIYIYIYIYIYI